jgi:type 1 fimbriae regulatory protein FimE
MTYCTHTFYNKMTAPMTATLQTPALDSKTEANPIPENDPKWESPSSEHQENGRIVEVSFNAPNTRKRESSAKPPRRVPNAERRSREFLTEAEVEKLTAAAESQGRHGHRDATMLMIGYRHALRVSELVALKWDQVDFPQALLHVKRLKNGNPSTHPLHGPELRALRKLQRDYQNSPYVFVGERNGPLTDSSVRKIVARAGVAAAFAFPVHPHQLRHGCGYRLANAGVDTRAIQCYLGHRNITHTTRYTELSPERFKSFWQD